MVPWCRFEAPTKVAVLFVRTSFSRSFYLAVWSHDTMTTLPRDASDSRAEGRYTFRLSNLPKVDLQIDKGMDFSAWRLQWQSYCSLSGLARETTSKQVEALSLCFSRETLSVVQNLGLTNDERNIVITIIETPNVFWSDGGPQFTSKQFQQFSNQWGLIAKYRPPLPTKQWESRIHCEGNEKNNSGSMEWQVFK